MITRRLFLSATSSAVIIRPANAATNFDVCVYGATPSGIAAAYAAAREGANTALIIGPNPFGGMCANGLGRTDHDTTAVIGGFPRTFFNESSKLMGIAPQLHLIPNYAHETFSRLIHEAGVTLIENNGFQVMLG